MDTQLLPRELNLERQAILRFADASDLQLACRAGAIWVTLDGDARDYVLETGETFQTSEHGRVIVYALQPSRVRVASAHHAAAEVPRGLQIESALRGVHA